MKEFEGVILPKYRVKFINQNNKEVNQSIPSFYGLKEGEFVGEKCKIFWDNNEIVRIELSSTGKELPRKQVEQQKQTTQSNRPNQSQNKGQGSSGVSHSNQQSNNANEYKSYLPKDTNGIIKQNQVENYLLRLQKFTLAENSDTPKEKFIFYKTDRGEEKFKVAPNFIKVDFKSITTRHHSNAKSLLGEANIKDMNLKTDWRMALGLGNESVYETSITLHHIYGIPYIPASAIKGVVRSWIITRVYGLDAPENEKDFPLLNAEFRALTNSEVFCQIFGCPKEIQKVKFENGKPVPKKDKNGKETKEYEKEKLTPVALKDQNGKGQEHQGKIIFFDAFPTNLKNESIKVDIMNPHYGEYYSSEGNNIKPPGDYYNPNPIPFLTVQDTSFQFIVGSKKNEIIDKSKELQRLIYIDGKKENPFFSDEDIAKTLNQKKSLEEITLLDLTYLWLKLSLTEHGIGAKTAVGYGYMTPQK